MHQNRIADISGKLGNGNAVPDDIILIVLPVLSDLSSLFLPGQSFKGILHLPGRETFPVSKEKMAVLMAPCTQRPLQLRYLTRRKHGFPVFRFHEGSEFLSGKCRFYLIMTILSGRSTAVNILRMIGESDAEFTVATGELFYIMIPEGRKAETEFSLLFLFGKNMEPLQEKGRGFFYNRVCVICRGELQRIQKQYLCFGERELQTENPLPVRKRQPAKEIQIICRPVRMFLYITGSICSAQIGQNRALCQLSGKNSVFQPKPEQPFVDIAFFILLKAVQDRFQLRVFVQPADSTDDTVPIEIRLSVFIEGFEIRCEIV